MLSRSWPRVLACGEPVDMRKSFDGLLGSVRSGLGEEPLSGDLYVFFNRERTILKCLWWDRTGWCVLGKKLERRRFQMRSKELKQFLQEKEFELLFDGVLRSRY